MYAPEYLNHPGNSPNSSPDGNEAEIGQVFKNTKVPREEYFVTTKL
jgi:hypothetical protein